MNIALADAQTQSKPMGGKRGLGDSPVSTLTSLLSQVPGSGGLCQQAEYLQAQSDAQEQFLAGNRSAQPSFPGPSDNQPASRAHNIDTQFSAPPGSVGGPPGPGVPGMSPDFDPAKTASQIYVSVGVISYHVTDTMISNISLSAHIGIPRQSCKSDFRYD